jgi:hypothetical protein
MVKEISGSFSPVTDARSRYLNFDSGSRDLELERPCTYEYAFGDRDVIFQLSVSFNKGFVVRYLELV